MEDHGKKVMKKWHKPQLLTMSQSEVDRAVVLRACSTYSGCVSRVARIF